MSKVFLREKKLMNGRQGLYLDFYPPIPHPETGKPTRREHLRLFVYVRPKLETEKNHNKETRLLAENIRAQRQLEFQAGNYGFVARSSKQKSFISFFQKVADDKKQTSKSNYESYLSVIKHLKCFAGEICLFSNITENFCRDFRNYLLTKVKISNNTAAAYFDKFKYVVRLAFEQNMLKENSARLIKSIKPEEVQREFLTLDELQKLAATPFAEYDDLRRAALFSALTGLRYSDIEKLIWSEIKYSSELGDYIRFRQKKTKDTETLQINEDARQLLGARTALNERVFPNLNYSQCVYLPVWTKRSGIERRITFHAFRHTHATIQLSLGTDIYTVSKLLGHRNIKTTEIYAHIIDETKRRAVNKISLKLR
jgi:integrase